MATSYTTNTHLGKPAVADRNWNTPLNANFDALDVLAPLGALAVVTAEVPSTTLNVRVSAGKYQKADGTVGTYAGTSSQAMTTAATNYLYLTDVGTLTVNTTGYPTTAHVRLATVVAGATTITSITDDRVTCMVMGTDAQPYLPLAGGTLTDGANVAVGTTTGTKIGTATTQKLGFYNATPIVRPGGFTQTYSTADKTIAAYTADVENAAYTGATDGEAKLADLNALRVAYENLRALAEDTTQALNALIDDLQSEGLIG